MKNTTLVIWLGRDVYLKTDEDSTKVTLPERGDQVDALCKLIVSLPGSPKSVRIVYQPAELDCSPIEVPKAGRNVLERILARDHLNLGTDNCAWACLTLFPAGRTYSSVLMIESAPRLQRLQHALFEQKISVAGAWPLPSLIERFAPFDTPKSPALAVVRTPNGAILYGVDKTGTRTIAAFQDEQFRASLFGMLGQQLALYDAGSTPPVYLFTAEPDTELEELLAPYSPLMPGIAPLLDAIANLSPKHPSNFLPGEFSINPNTLLAAVGGASLLLAAILSALYVLDIRRVSEDQRSKRAEADRLSVRISSLEKNQEAIEAARSFTNEANPASARPSELIHFLSRNIPQSITLRTFKVNNLAFTIDGISHDYAKNSAEYQKFITALTSFQSCRFVETARPGTTPEFTLNGTFAK